MVQVINITQTSMRVTWDTHGSDVAHYNIELYYGPDEYGDPVEGKQIYGISPSARGYNFTGLSAGRLYHVKLYSKNSAQQTIKIERVNFSTLSNNPVPGTPSLSVSVTDRRNLFISGYKGSDTDYIEIYINGTRQWNMYMGSESYFSVTYYGSYSTTYTVMVQGRNSWNTGSSRSTTVTTLSAPPPDPPATPTNFNIYNSGETWASFAWNAVPNATSYSLEIWQGNSLAVPGHYGFNDRTRTVTGLSPGVSYMAKVYANNDGGSGAAVTFWFELGFSRPANFDWTKPKVKGSQYRIQNGRYIDLISYDELIAFRQRINDFRRHKKLAAYSFTPVFRNGDFTDDHYNELNEAIADMAPPTLTPGRRSSGPVDMVGLLNGLRNSLNSI